MSLNVTAKSASSVPPLEAGVYDATCIGVVDVGTQENKAYKKWQSKIIMVFEVIGETVTVEDEVKPRWLSRMYTASLNDKSGLTKIVTALVGRPLTDEEKGGFGLGGLIGSSCQISVTLNSSDDGARYNSIDGAFPLRKGTKLDEYKSDAFLFDMDDPSTYAALEIMPEWMRQRVEASPDWAKHAPKETVDMSGTSAPAPSGEPTRGPGF